MSRSGVAPMFIGAIGVSLLSLGVINPADAAVGRTPGQPGVSQIGSAQYQIPFSLPPGRLGLVPQLGLVYSSNGGRGVAGLGWAIAGASVISRCGKTIAQDGEATGIYGVIADGYCLNGNRLRLTGGTYGTAGSTYRTEIDAFSRITVVASGLNGPGSFKVERRDGLIEYYGDTADSSIEFLGQSTIRAWAINKITDRQNNTITFTWATDTVNGAHRLEQVRYTGSGSEEGPYTVDFQYAPRADKNVRFIAGSRVEEIYRLIAVDVTYSGTPVRRYSLGYDTSPATQRERLISIQECAGSDCLSPSTFTYENGSIGLGTLQTAVANGTRIDINGDGRDDLVYASATTNGTHMVAFANATGGFNAPVNTGVPVHTGSIYGDYNADGKADILSPISGTWYVKLGTATGIAAATSTGAPVTSTGNGTNAALRDVTGDGRADLVWADLVGFAGGDAIRYRAGLSTGGFSSTVTTLVGGIAANNRIFAVYWGTSHRKPLDFNADRRADFALAIEKRTSSLPEPISPEFMSQASVDSPQSDSSSSELAAGPVTYTYSYRLNGYCGVGLGGCWIGPSGPSAGNHPNFGDYNGDGKTDVFYWHQDGYYHYVFSTGTGTTGEYIGPQAYDFNNWTVADWDGDGFDDAITPYAATGKWHVMRSNGVSFEAPFNTQVAFVGTDPTASTTDINGDSIDDIAYTTYSGGVYTPRYHLRTLTAAPPDVLTVAEDGYGTRASFTYAPISQAAVYSKGSGTAAPNIDVTGGLWVVSRLSQTDGSGTTAETATDFTYAGARENIEGRGFLGFDTRTTIDRALGHNLKNIERYRQDFPYIGALTSSEGQLSDGTRVSYTTNTWSSLTGGTGYNVYRYPYVSTSTTDTHEIASPYTGTKIRSVTTAVASGGIDSESGLITDVSTTTTEVATGLYPGSSKTERTYHAAPVFNDTTNWCIGRPQTTQQINSHTLAFGTAVTRKSGTTWDGAACRPTQTQVEPGSGTMQVTVVLGYDAFGNISSEAVTGIGMPTRTTTTNWGTDGRFPRTLTNALNETTQQGWNAELGLPASLTDANGLTTSWTYDGFGRPLTELRPDGTSAVSTYANCPSGCDSRVKMGVTRQQKDTSGQVIHAVTDYLDRWDRLIWQKTQLLTTNDTSWTVRREYDARGSLTKDYAPYLGTSDNGYRQTSYDAVNRPTAVGLYRAGGVHDRTVAVGYAGLAVSETGPGQSTTRTTSAWGDVVRISDPTGAVNRQYDAFGLVKQTTDQAGNVVLQMTYNAQGMPTTMADIDRGTWGLVPNALGEVVSQTDAKGQTTSLVYDTLGRLYQRVEAEGTSTWVWGKPSDNTGTSKFVGNLKTVTGPGYGEEFSYDQLGRPTVRTIVSDQTYQFDITYSAANGQIETLAYPLSVGGPRFKAKYGYTGGYLTSVQDYTNNTPGTVLWNLNLLDARMNAVSETYGNGLWLQNTYDTLTGEPLTRQSGTGGQTTNVQNLRYTWNTAGNLEQREDLRQSLAESFQYDAANRLRVVTGPGGQSTIDFDAIGNVTAMTGVGSYTYHPTKKHAVANAGGTAYGYDANGNMTSRAGASITWSSANLPILINAPGGFSAQFDYAPDRARWRQVSTYSNGTETTIYVGGLLEKVSATGPTPMTHWKHLIPTPSGQVQLIRRSDGSSDVLYVTTDHLGSTDAVLDASGAVILQASFNPFGERRGSNWQGAPTSGDWQQIAQSTRQGFTGHEMLDNVSLIHMNGRVFDPRIGRFLSADPYIDGTETTQGWNRYGYVQGRVLSLTDPSGFSGTQRYQRPQRSSGWTPWGTQVVYDSAWNQPRDTASRGGPSGSEYSVVPVGHTIDTSGQLENVILNYRRTLVSEGSVPSLSFNPRAGLVQTREDGGGGDSRTPKMTSSESKCPFPALVAAGNFLASAADNMYKASSYIVPTGLAVATAGAVATSPAGGVGAGPGLAMATAGGYVGLGGAAAQFGAGILQGVGSNAGFWNSQASFTAWLTGKVGTFPFGTSARATGSAAQRRLAASSSRNTTAAGGLIDSAVGLMDSLKPQQVKCEQ